MQLDSICNCVAYSEIKKAHKEDIVMIKIGVAFLMQKTRHGNITFKNGRCDNDKYCDTNKKHTIGNSL